MALLLINCGSSSVKYELREGGERLGGDTIRDVTDYGAAVERALADARQEHVDAVVHRVVHGGRYFTAPTLIDEDALDKLRELAELAPLHNARALAAIEASRRLLGADMPMVATFDTSFHAAMPAPAASYALPPELTERHAIRRYGFHGLAHRYMAERFHDPGARLITLQLGSGCSAAAIAGGRSLDTSMGLTPLEGLVMATRAGDVDPALPAFLEEHEGIDATDAAHIFNEESGLKGLSGRSGDMRELLEADDERSRLAVELYCYRIRKYVGAYLAVLAGADALVFGGGVGENSAAIRSRVCHGMDWCGIELDEERNEGATGAQVRIDAGSGLEVWVMQVDEAEVMARDAEAVLGGKESG